MGIVFVFPGNDGRSGIHWKEREMHETKFRSYRFMRNANTQCSFQSLEGNTIVQFREGKSQPGVQPVTKCSYRKEKAVYVKTKILSKCNFMKAVQSFRRQSHISTAAQSSSKQYHFPKGNNMDNFP